MIFAFPACALLDVILPYQISLGPNEAIKKINLNITSASHKKIYFSSQHVTISPCVLELNANVTQFAITIERLNGLKRDGNITLVSQGGKGEIETFTTAVRVAELDQASDTCIAWRDPRVRFFADRKKEVSIQ